MTTIQRFDPFRELQQLRRLMHGPSPLFGPAAIRDAAATAWSIPLDVRRDARELTVSAALPGFAADEVEVSISPERVLAVKASRQSETAAETGRETAEYLLRERRGGSLARAIRLPGGLDLDGAAVNLEHGVLTVTVPVAAAAQTRKLTIGGGDGSGNGAGNDGAGAGDGLDADAGNGNAAGNDDAVDGGFDAAAVAGVC